MKNTKIKMDKTLERIHIIGGPGSGKSELATRLSVLMPAPVVRLDEIAYNDAALGAFGSPTDRDLRLRRVDEYSQQSCWIAEGVYFSWLGKSFREAQHIILLQTPVHIRAHNIQQRLKALPDTATKQAHLEHLLRKNDEYDELFESRISGFLSPFEVKIRVFSGPGKACKHFKRLLAG
ncbi:hypothetical protein [Pseudomonas synxantha]|uniref:hypothetical protein n=1 Tax=Pseudomonas synxantha TaxID=47883 RepID=UPI000F55E662|nr:hypothetical protein [Pseudomonas synxantha]